LRRRHLPGHRARRDRRPRAARRGQDARGLEPHARRAAGTQHRLAEAEGTLLAARAFFYEAVATAWAGTADELAGRAGLRLAATHAARTAADVTRTMYDLGGGSAIYESSPLQRRFRDAHTATAHFQVAPQTYEVIGRVMLGLPADTSRL
jgi:indole-3-acetate monooxygenase